MTRRFSADLAVIPAEKLRDYLLSPTHPVGRFKAAFFGGLGYGAESWPRLAADLRAQHLILEATPIEASPFGQKYLIQGPLTGPAGRTAVLVSIWIILSGEDAPRLVTLFPRGP